MALDKASILGAVDSKLTAVDVPEWGGTVYVRVMSGKARNDWESSLEERRGNFRAALLVRTLADENGNRLFDDADIEALGSKSATVLDRLFDESFKVNALGQYALDTAKKN